MSLDLTDHTLFVALMLKMKLIFHFIYVQDIHQRQLSRCNTSHNP